MKPFLHLFFGTVLGCLGFFAPAPAQGQVQSNWDFQYRQLHGTFANNNLSTTFPYRVVHDLKKDSFYKMPPVLADHHTRLSRYRERVFHFRHIPTGKTFAFDGQDAHDYQTATTTRVQQWPEGRRVYPYGGNQLFPVQGRPDEFYQLRAIEQNTDYLLVLYRYGLVDGTIKLLNEKALGQFPTHNIGFVALLRNYDYVSGTLYFYLLGPERVDIYLADEEQGAVRLGDVVFPGAHPRASSISPDGSRMCVLSYEGPSTGHVAYIYSISPDCKTLALEYEINFGQGILGQIWSSSGPFGTCEGADRVPVFSKTGRYLYVGTYEEPHDGKWWQYDLTGVSCGIAPEKQLFYEAPMLPNGSSKAGLQPFTVGLSETLYGLWLSAFDTPGIANMGNSELPATAPVAPQLLDGFRWKAHIGPSTCTHMFYVDYQKFDTRYWEGYPFRMKTHGCGPGGTELWVEHQSDEIDSIVWEFSDGTVLRGERVSHVAANDSRLEVHAHIYWGCMRAVLRDSVWFHPPAKHASPIPSTAVVCDAPLAVRPALPDNAAGHWADMPTQPPHERLFSGPGTFWFVTGYGSGCEARDSIVVHKSTLPEIALSVEDLCGDAPTGRLLLAGLGAAHAAVWHDSTVGATLTVSEPGQYCATVSDTLGCSRELCAEVGRYGYLPSPWADGLDTSVCPGHSAFFAAPEGKPLHCPDGTSGPSCVFHLPGSYTVHYRPSPNCPPQEIEVFVHHLPPDDTLCLGCPWTIPNAVTPTNDALNETWQPVNDCPGSTYCYEIYNRWGQRVFSACDQPWTPASEGVYMYRATLRTAGEKEAEQASGTVTVVK